MPRLKRKKPGGLKVDITDFIPLGFEDRKGLEGSVDGMKPLRKA